MQMLAGDSSSFGIIWSGMKASEAQPNSRSSGKTAEMLGGASDGSTLDPVVDRSLLDAVFLE